MVLWPKILTLEALVAVRSLFEFEKLEFFTDFSKYEMTTVVPNRRGLKTTRSQFELYLNELRINKSLRDNKFDGSDPDILKRTWDQLSEKLNALGGPCRDVNGWKRVICDWKSQTRAKARKLRLAQTQTGNDGVPPKPLTDLEESLLDLTGQVVVTGLAYVKEIGIDGPIKPVAEVFISKESTIDVANHFEMENGSDDRSRTLSTSSKKK